MIGLNFSLQELLKKFEEVFSDLFECGGIEQGGASDPKDTQVLNASENSQFLGYYMRDFNIIDH